MSAALAAATMLATTIPARAATGDIATVAGGPGLGTALAVPQGAEAVAVFGGRIYSVDPIWNVVRVLDPSTGQQSIAAGNGTLGDSGDGGPATQAQLDQPNALLFDPAGDMYVVDTFNHCVRRVDATTHVIATVAGACGPGGFGGDGGPATSALLSYPAQIALDQAGNLFIADTINNRVRRVDAATHVMSTIAGNGVTNSLGLGGFSGDNGPALQAQMYWPEGVSVDSAGDVIISDTMNQRIRQVDGVVSADGTHHIHTVVGDGNGSYGGDGGPATAAQIFQPYYSLLDHGGNLIFADLGNARIRSVAGVTSPGSHVISTVAGNGTAGFGGDGGVATAAQLSNPYGVAFAPDGTMYIADSSNLRLRAVDATTRVIRTVAGNGTPNDSPDGTNATAAELAVVTGVAIDNAGNLYYSDSDLNQVRMVDAHTHAITTIAGAGAAGYGGDQGAATSALLDFPGGLALDAGGNLYIADTFNHRIRRVDAAPSVDGTRHISTVAGNGQPGFVGDGAPAVLAELNYPQDVSVDSAGNMLIADTLNHRIRRVPITGTAAQALITTIAGGGGGGAGGYSGDGGPATSAQLNAPQDVVADGGGNLFIADTDNNRIRRVDAMTSSDGTHHITTLAGDGTGGLAGDGGRAIDAELQQPGGLALDGKGRLLVCDMDNRRVRVIDGTGTISTFAGSGTPSRTRRGGVFSGDGGPATAATLNGPSDVALDSVGNAYIADTFDSRIRVVSATDTSPPLLLPESPTPLLTLVVSTLFVVARRSIKRGKEASRRQPGREAA